MTRSLFFVLLCAFLSRIGAANVPAIGAMLAGADRFKASTEVTKFDRSKPHLASIPGSDLALAEMIESSESFGEQVLKKSKYVPVLLAFVFCVRIADPVYSILCYALLFAGRPQSRKYLSISVLRI